MSVVLENTRKSPEILPTFDADAVREILPHGSDFPWLIDEATIIRRGEGYACQARVQVTNYHCRGHFRPGMSQILPRVATEEFVAQAALILCHFQHDGDVAVFSDEFSGRFEGKPIKSGERLTINAWVEKQERRACTVAGEVLRSDGS